MQRKVTQRKVTQRKVMWNKVTEVSKVMKHKHS